MNPKASEHRHGHKKTTPFAKYTQNRATIITALIQQGKIKIPTQQTAENFKSSAIPEQGSIIAS